MDTEIADAVAEAAATGANVEIDSLATAESEVYAAPDGTFVEDIALEPFQALTGDGTWAPIDNTLVESANGTFVPVTSDSGLEISGGGDNVIARITDIHDRSVAYTWHENLPDPVISGDTATFAEVFPGVDLKIRATNDGFAKVFEVKTAEAAASADVASIELGVELDGFTAAVGETGALEISDYSGAVVYAGPTPTMWDSTPPDEDAGDSASIEWSPSSFALSATVGTAYSDSVLTLTPDAAMLADPAAVYPIRIDPKWVSIGKSAWALASDYGSYANTNYFNGGSFEKDKNGTARLGRAHRQDGSKEQTWRLAFEFNTDKFRGRQILEADFIVQMTYSWVPNCNDVTPSFGIYELDANLRKWTWNKPGSWGDKLATREEGVGSGCGAPRDITTDVTGYVADVAATSDKSIQFGMKVSNEDSCCNSFRRFGPEKTDSGSGGVHLSVRYNTPPNKPTNLLIGGKSCTTGKTVSLGAGVSWSAKATFSDAEADNMTGYLKFTNKSTGAVTVRSVDAANKTTSSWPGIPTSTLADGNYTALAYANDGKVNGPGSASCTVTVDKTAPKAPTVTSADYPNDGVIHGGFGQTGTFTFASTSTDTAGYKWSLQDAADTSLISATNIAAPSLGKPITVPIKMPSSGPLTLSVWAYDKNGNTSAETEYKFLVDDYTDPVTHWKLDEGSGTTAADTDYSYVYNLTRPLTVSGAVWGASAEGDAESGRNDYLTFDGVNDYAQTSAQVVNTAKSFTVSTWVRIHETDVDYSIASQDGLVNSGFMLKYDGESQKFLIVACSQDSSSATCPSAGSTTRAKVDTWYNVTGVYDLATKQIRIYVNGQLQGTTTITGTFNATGKFVLGRDLFAGASTTFFAGDIDEVKVWDRAISLGEIQRWGQHTNGSWSFDGNTNTSFADASGYRNTLTGNGTVELVEGVTGQGGGFNGVNSTATSTSQVINTASDFTISAWVRLDSDDSDATIISQDGAHNSPFYLGYIASSKKWTFRATSGDASGAELTGNLLSEHNAAVGQWTHLTVVYTAPTSSTAGSATLYVNGIKLDDVAEDDKAKGSATTRNFTLWSSTGALRIGSELRGGTVRAFFPGTIDSVVTSTGAFDRQQVAALSDENVRETRSELVSGDFDGDGDTDALAAVNVKERHSEVYVLENDGAGNFTRSEKPALSTEYAQVLEDFGWHLDDAQWRAGNVNQDACDDLILAVPGTSGIEINAFTGVRGGCGAELVDGQWFNDFTQPKLKLENLDANADGVFEVEWLLSETQVQVTDFTGDEADDVVMLRSDGASGYSIWGVSLDAADCIDDCIFGTETRLATGSGSSRQIELAAADFDNNDCGDIAEIRTGADNLADIYIRYNNKVDGLCSASGDAPALAEPVLRMNASGNWNTDRDRVTIGDVNGDGFPDFVMSYRNSSRVRLQAAIFDPGLDQYQMKTMAHANRCTGCTADLTQWQHVDLAMGNVDGSGGDDLLTLRAGVGGAIGALWTRASTNGTYPVALPAWADPTTCFGAEGDVNGDGYPDAVIANGTHDAGGLADSGGFYFVDGATGAVGIVAERTHGTAGTVEAGDQFGYAVDTYDRDGDGCSDIVVGVPGENSGSGSAIILPGAPSGVSNSAVDWFSQQKIGVPGASEAGDRYGFSVAASNRTDGTPVVIIGVPGEDVQTDTTGSSRDGDNSNEVVDAGALVYLQGSTKVWIDQNTVNVGDTVESGDQFGYSIASTPTRFIVGAPYEDGGTSQIVDSGGTFLFSQNISSLGQPSYIDLIDQEDAILASGVEAGDRLGHAVAAVDYWPSGSGVNDVQTRLAFTVPAEDISSNTIIEGGLVHLVNLDSANVSTHVANYTQGSALSDAAENNDHVAATVGLFDLNPTVQANAATLQLAIGVTDEDYKTADDDGFVHITSAAVPAADVDTVVYDPAPITNGKFGTALAALPGSLFITSPGSNTLNRFAWADAASATFKAATAIAS
ncbi:hypothetical protein GCM10009782_05150 [Glycomyces algeriensis]